MPYTEEQWEYYSDWKNFSEKKDLQYSEQEFDYFLNRLKTNKPFSIVRFGEGESRVFLREQKLIRPELTFDPTTEKTQQYTSELENSTKINHPDYFVGIQSYTYKPKEKDRPEDEFIKQRNRVVAMSNLPREQYTCSRVFCNFYKRCNLELLPEIKKRDVYLVCSNRANESKLGISFKKVWKISPQDAWKNDRKLYEDIRNTMDSIGESVFLTCGGFFGNIAISKLSSGKNFNINVGSVYDPLLLGKYTRPYQRV